MNPNGNQAPQQRLAPVVKTNVIVKAELINPEGDWEDRVMLEIDSRAPKQLVVAQLVKSLILSQGGLIRQVSEAVDEWEYIRLDRVKRITVSFPAIELVSSLALDARIQ